MILFLNYLGYDLNYIDNKILELKKGKIPSVKNPLFPVNLQTKEFAGLIGYIVSDGSYYKESLGNEIYRVKYSSSDLENLNDFKKLVNLIFGEMHIEEEDNLRGNIYLKIGSSIIPSALQKVNLSYGNKTKKNIDLPHFIFSDLEFSKEYLRKVFSDEGSVGGGNGKGYNPYVVITRYSWIDDFFTLKDLELINLKLVPLMTERKFPTGHKIKSISFKKAQEILGSAFFQKVIFNGRSKLLLGESEILNILNINHRLWDSRISLTQNGHISLVTDLYITKKVDLLKFYKEVGFSLTRKQQKLKVALMEVGWIESFKNI